MNTADEILLDICKTAFLDELKRNIHEKRAYALGQMLALRYPDNPVDINNLDEKILLKEIKR